MRGWGPKFFISVQSDKDFTNFCYQKPTLICDLFIPRPGLFYFQTIKQFAAAVVRIMKNFHLKALLQWQWITEERSVLNSFNGQSRIYFYQTKVQKLPSRSGLEVEAWTDNSLHSASVGLNPAWVWYIDRSEVERNTLSQFELQGAGGSDASLSLSHRRNIILTT